jgi:hypothetical protein
MAIRLFGFQLSRDKNSSVTKTEEYPSFAPPTFEDGASIIQSSGYMAATTDFDVTYKNEVQLITRYRTMSLQPEIEGAIDDIVNEAVVHDETGKSVDLVLDNSSLSASVKNKILEEFKTVLKLLNFSNRGHQIFRRWYIDGRLYYHIIVDPERSKEGIKELRYIDPRKIRKIREILRKNENGIEVIDKITEYFVYNDRGLMSGTTANLGIKIAPDSIAYVTSGLMDPSDKVVLSYLHKAIRPLNLLRATEDAVAIYRVVRAPERRVFYIDVGSLATKSAEKYIKDQMMKYRNKIVYDSTTGEIKDDRKFNSMIEDIWLARREGSKGKEIETLQGAQNIGDLQDVSLYQKNLYKALGVPFSRTESSQGFTLGRASEITRDELKFSKFVDRLRGQFSVLFDDLLAIQLSLKGICTKEEWLEIREEVYYDFLKDNNFTELKEIDLLRERVSLLATVENYVGTYYSQKWVKRNVLKMTDEEIEEMKKEMLEEQEAEVERQRSMDLDGEGKPLPPGETYDSTNMETPPEGSTDKEFDKKILSGLKLREDVNEIKNMPLNMKAEQRQLMKRIVKEMEDERIRSEYH